MLSWSTQTLLPPFLLTGLFACFCFVEVELSGREERARKNSDSVLYPSVKEELSMLKMKRIQAAFNQRIAFMEKEIEEVSERYVYPSSSPLKTD